MDNVWGQEKLEARKMLENRADSHTACPELVEGSTARFVSLRSYFLACWLFAVSILG